MLVEDYSDRPYVVVVTQLVYAQRCYFNQQRHTMAFGDVDSCALADQVLYVLGSSPIHGLPEHRAPMRSNL